MSEIDIARAWEKLPYAWGGHCIRGVMRAEPEDFFVDEALCFEPDGAGEHLMIHVEKRDANTEWVARHLARALAMPVRDVAYAGMKDRHAVTRQWFSLRQPIGQDPDPASLEGEGIRVLDIVRHGRKLRRGAISLNRFRIRIREVEGDLDGLAQRVVAIAKGGVPNYFGEQRFGRDGGNLIAAQRLFSQGAGRLSRHKKGLYLSAARSFLFNRILASRVEEGSWDRGVAGDVMMLDGKRAVFTAEVGDDALAERLATLDIHPTGAMWGRGELMTTADAAEVERRETEPYAAWREGLERFGLDQERRSLRLPVREMAWRQIDDGDVEFSFALPSGSFATAVLRELVQLRQGFDKVFHAEE